MRTHKGTGNDVALEDTFQSLRRLDVHVPNIYNYNYTIIQLYIVCTCITIYRHSACLLTFYCVYGTVYGMCYVLSAYVMCASPLPPSNLVYCIHDLLTPNLSAKARRCEETAVVSTTAVELETSLNDRSEPHLHQTERPIEAWRSDTTTLGRDGGVGDETGDSGREGRGKTHTSSQRKRCCLL